MNVTKLLILGHPETDYLAYFTYRGLRQLGVDVVEYPRNPCFHGEVHRYPIPWYGTDKMGFSGPPTFFEKFDGKKYSGDEEVLAEINDFDYILLESPRNIPVETLERLYKKRGLPPVVLVDGEDYGYVHTELMQRYGIEVCFKRECECRASNVVPFPFSSYIIGDKRFEYPDEEKEYDLFFLAGNTHILRVFVLERLKRIVEKHKLKAIVALDQEPVDGLAGVKETTANFRFEPRYNPLDLPLKAGIRYGLKQYLELTAKSKIAISVRGFGHDSLRMWEIPSYNTLLLSDSLYDQGLIHPYPFTHEKNIIFFKNDLSDLEYLILYYLENESERLKVIRAQKEWVTAHHTNIQRARQLVERLQQ